MAPARIAWNKQVQNRVSVTSSVLQQIKNIKMIGLRPVVADLVQGLRETEMQCSKRFRVLEVIMSASGSSPCSLSPFPSLSLGRQH